MKVVNMVYDRLIKVASWTGNVSSDYCIAALLTTVVYFVSYLRYPATPGNHELNFIGWFNMADQGAYLVSAKAIAHWKLSPETYIYPLGYPLLGAFFVHWLPRHLFLIPNLIFSVGIVLAFYASCRKFVAKIEGLSLTVFLIILSALAGNKILPGGLIWFNSLILPWNLIPVFFAAYLAAWLLVFNAADFRKLWIVSLVIALAFFARPPDILFLGIIYLAGLTDLKSLKEKIWGIVIFLVPNLLVLITTLITKWEVFGAFLSPYDLRNMEYGFGFHDLLFKFYLVFFDGSPIYGYKEFMFVPQMPWLLLCIPGAVLLAKRTNGKSWFLVVSMAICLVLYISFNAQSPSNLFTYYGFRYFIWVFPWLGLCAYLTLTRSGRVFGFGKTIAGALVGVLFAVVIGWKETTVVTIFPGNEVNAEQYYQNYDVHAKSFEGKMSLHAQTPADGFKLAFSTPPSKNMTVASFWEYFKLLVDGKKQILYRDYNLYQLGNVVYVTFRNPINKTGKLREATFQFDGTDFPVLKRIEVVDKEFEPVGFLKKMLLRSGMASNQWNVSDDQPRYDWGSDLTFGVGGNARPYMLSGWSDDEQGYTWAEGRLAILGLKTPPIRHKLALILDAAGLTSPTPQVAEIEINGNPLEKIVLSSSRKTYNISIPEEYLRSDGVMIIRFGLPNAISPLELGMNRDKRHLSMSVFKLDLYPK
jgi:hypothetical protein